jgi:hypothetical protein
MKKLGKPWALMPRFERRPSAAHFSRRVSPFGHDVDIGQGAGRCVEAGGEDEDVQFVLGVPDPHALPGGRGDRGDRGGTHLPLKE